MASRDDGGVVVVVEGRRTEVDEAYVRALYNTIVASLLPIMHRYVVGAIEENVLRLEVCVCQLVVVHETHCVAQLVANVPHVLYRVAHVIVLPLQKATFGGNKSDKNNPLPMIAKH